MNMSKDQTWKIIFFLTDEKMFIPNFFRLDNDQFFSILFQTPYEPLSIRHRRCGSVLGGGCLAHLGVYETTVERIR